MTTRPNMIDFQSKADHLRVRVFC